MTGGQAAAFTAATQHSPGDVSIVIASILAVLMFIWAAWIVVKALSSYHKRETREADLVFAALRVSGLIAVALYVLM